VDDPYLEATRGAAADEAQQLFLSAQSAGYLVKNAQGGTFVTPASLVKGGAGLVDFTSAPARAFWESLVDRATAVGVSGFKIDYGEDLIPNLLEARLDLQFADGTTGRSARLYPIAEQRTYHESLDRAVPGAGVLIVRASSYGGATQADIIWPGDLDNDFEHFGDPAPNDQLAVGGLPSAVVAAQTLGASGFPVFGSDTGGYRYGMPSREVLLRWAEHTALSVILQLGGGGTSHDPWAYDEDAATIYAGLARLHMRLVPYLRLLQLDAAARGTPTVRSLPLAYPQDGAARARADDEYLLGLDFLVAPVVASGQTARRVYLPAGLWVRWWDDALIVGPADFAEDAPLGLPPFFARVGALVPLLPDGIDTLADATDRSTVTLAAHAHEIEARAWVRGPARVTLDEGSAIAVADDASGVTLSWSPAALTTLTTDLDLRSRGGGSAAPTSLATLFGTPPVKVMNEASVRASTASAYAIDPVRGHAYVRLIGAASVELR
jgi:alpha-glucosidase (family GH31 glycosyl hydrolase)